MLTDFDDDLEVGSDEETEAMTAAEVLLKLEEAWLNEKFSPDLQENHTDIVDCVIEQLQVMEDNVERAKKGDFKVSIHKMEIDRIRYVLSSYLRIRLQKIEKYTAFILEQENNADRESRLSPEELKFAMEYKENMESHFKSLALKDMPPSHQTLDPKLTTIYPQLDSYVFLRVNENTEGVMVEDGSTESRDEQEVIDLEKGDQHIMRYRPIAELVTSGSVSLM